MIEAGALASLVADARRRTLEIYADLSDAQIAVPYLRNINPPLWEMGHVAWFQEHWALRHALGGAPMRADADALWDSMKVAHATRWGLAGLPSRGETIEYLEVVRDRVVDALRNHLDAKLLYFVMLSVLHEDMHDEAFAYTRQTMEWPAPRLTESDEPPLTMGGPPGQTGPSPPLQETAPLLGDVEVPGGTWRLGIERSRAPLFVFDNEKWAHDVDIAPFRIARAPVTQAELAAFVDDGGYGRRELWTDEGWAFRVSAQAEHPLYWRRAGSRWERRVFDRWVPISREPNKPAIHVCAHEAEAWCRWAGRRLPTEPEWEMAASGFEKRTYPWGEEPPSPAHANLDARLGDTVDVAAFPAGDSVFGCRQMIGNVWEWTATVFQPYPGFVADPYKDYSEPWFGDHRVLRGGCFVTRARLLRNTWRNFYTPDRRDVWAGFRTCAIR